MISRKRDDSGSSINEKETDRLPALNQSRNGTTTDFPEMLRNMFNENMNETRTVTEASMPAAFLGSLLFNKPSIRNPISGQRGINGANCVIQSSAI
jgi:hypothetical protein